jgi:hypothetical protein
MTLIHGRVARLLSFRELVLNVGSDAGVEVGMLFRVLNPRGMDIRDPDNPSETLGDVEIVKVVVRVSTVQRTLSVAETFRTTTIPARQGYGTLAGLSSYGSLSERLLGDPGRPERTTLETFRAGENKAEPDFDEKESIVKVGDPVQQVPK